ncbi:glycoside hydrolase family 35 protein [Paenibacillus tengchongensis]|uniref:glycoside hydrolase family 35 protein n=1 Tax=Paenibacillus tengchongensis TaxID=2608684 RepID=UPI001FE736C7|nr:beta-galactosidase family protein [Paenibacillus tengchongensis]
MARLAWKDQKYWLDGRELRILAGALHYFRVVPEYWEDRLLKLKACGFNTVETYIPWNFHEPEEGVFRFGGMADVERFVRLAGQLGLHVILRPSPYICAEWEFGGLPAWLLKSEMALRCMDPAYLEKVDRYYDELIPRLVPLLGTNGGPVIAVQVENEYGSYGNDTAYLAYLRDGLIRRGVDCLLFTSDGPTDEMLIGGTVEGLHATVNFGSRVSESFAKYREYRQDEPLMVMEYWLGWFDHWREPHHVREAADVAAVLDEMLEQGSSVNLYMFHGGTNFGFYSGANHIAGYEPTVTSYDYDAPLTEWGDITEKYQAIRAVLDKHGVSPGGELPAPQPKQAIGVVKLTETADLLSQAEHLAVLNAESVTTRTMEELGQNYGFILYSTWIKGPRTGQQLHLRKVRDRAQVFLNGALLGVVERWNPQPLDLTVPPEGARLDILVENMGRVNYGPWLRDRKGITEGVLIDNQYQFNWTISTLPMEPELLERVCYSGVGEVGGEDVAVEVGLEPSAGLKAEPGAEQYAESGTVQNNLSIESKAGPTTTKLDKPGIELSFEPNTGIDKLSNGPSTEPDSDRNETDADSTVQSGAGASAESSAEASNGPGTNPGAQVTVHDQLHAGRPAFYRGSFTAAAREDTFLRFDGWGKGVAWINGFNLGRYWSAGPQRALYIPGPLLREGGNELVLLELHSCPEEPAVELTAEPDLGAAAVVDERVLNFVQEE